MKYGVWICLCISFATYGYNVKFLNKLINRAPGESINILSRDFRGIGVQLKGKDLSNLQFSGADFSPCTSEGVTLSGFICAISDPVTVSDFTDTNFSGSLLVSVNFAQANLTNANFSNADVSYVNFAGANLTGVNFTGAIGLDTAVFCNATMPDGTKCASGIWKSTSGLDISCNCPTTSSGAKS